MSDTLEVKEKNILNYLLVPGNKLTGYKATIDFGYTNMAKYACKLIDKGFPVKREWATDGHYKYYSIEQAA